MLVAAMNPCPCVYYREPTRPCTCAPSTVTKYQKRISGPLLDRIDIHVEVPWVDYQNPSDNWLEAASEAILRRVEKACELQRKGLGSSGARDRSATMGALKLS